MRTRDIRTSRVRIAAVFGVFVFWTPFTLILILEFGFQITIPSSKRRYTCYSQFFRRVCINPIIYGLMNRSSQTSCYAENIAT